MRPTYYYGTACRGRGYVFQYIYDARDTRLSSLRRAVNIGESRYLPGARYRKPGDAVLSLSAED
jgi:hypothetical protein